MVKFKTGDLLKATETVIAHQVNCYGVAGGLAYHVFDKYPDAHNDYVRLVQQANPLRLLGTAQPTSIQEDGHIIYNLFGQCMPGADYRPEALEKALGMLAERTRAMGWSVALPYKISCGIAGGDWNEVLQIIERTMEGVYCVIYQREGDI